MNFNRLAIFFCFFCAILQPGCAGHSSSLHYIETSPDHSGFIDSSTQQPFHPWGFNYDRDYRMRLLEDYWRTEWPAVASDFAEMKRLGANVVRIHLQFARFMNAPDQANAESLDQLKKLLKLAEQTGLHLDITGLACYRRSDVPGWYTNLDEQHRWDAQAHFWEAIARACAGSPAVFCYDLINEPAVPSEKRKPGDWLTGDLGAFTYCQFISLDPAGRDRTEMAVRWVGGMSAAIRKHDPRALITVGLLPFPQGSGFDAARLAPHLDFISVHYYPDGASDLAKQAQLVKRFSVGKPLVVEEIFPLKCDTRQLGDFMDRCPFVAGWIGFYWGKPAAQLEKSKEFGDLLTADWLRFFSNRPTR